MSYCPTCGRQRTGNGRYCGGCGRDFGVAPMTGSTAPAAEPVPVAEPAAAERAPEAEPARLDAPVEDAAPTVTVMGDWPAPSSPAPQPPVPPRPAASRPAASAPVPPTWAEPVGPPQGGRQGRWPTVWILVTVIVLLAAGGGTFLLIKHVGQRQPTGQGGGSTVTGGTTAPTGPASTQASVSPSPSASPSPPVSPSPTATPSVVSIDPAVTNVSAQVEVVLSHYFQGINDRDYAEYASSQTAQGKEDQPQSSFDAGYATTTDTDMTLASLTPTGGGDLTAAVTFTSHQSPSDSVDDSACNDWMLNLYLVPNGAGYLIRPAPPDYEPTHTDC